MDIKNIFKIDMNIKFYFKALTLLLIISVVFGFITAQQFPVESEIAVEQVVEDLAFVEELSITNIFLLITLNNSVKAFFMMLLGILWGIIPVIFILLNGYSIGIVISVVIAESGFISTVFGVLPHGVLEIPAILIAASYGVWLGEMFAKKLKRKTMLNVHVKKALSKFVRIVLPILIVAAFIETFITGWILNNLI